MRDTKILLVSHIYYTDSGPVYGPVNVIKDYLENKKRKYLLIGYPLVSKLPLIIKSFFETINTIFKSISYKPDIFIGIDPLNAFAGIVLKKLDLVNKTIFYCVDYTPTRFENKFLNICYLKIDEFCAKNSDEVWNVSTRIIEVRKKQGVANEKIKFIPNSPSFDKCPRLPINKIDRNKIVMVMGLTHSPIFDLVLKSFKKVSKELPNLNLSLIGTGVYQGKLAAKVSKMRLSKNVKLLGQLSNKDLLEEVSKSSLALAIYTFSKNYSWVYYGDSKKAREYLACGVPIVITDVVGTSEDVRKYDAGLVIKLSVEELTQAIEKIIRDNKLWLKYRENAIKLGRDFDIDSILSTNL
ncbi:MAG: Glycosyltransferase [Candidatus Woesebacteria bacterium GW2011_GWB1_39_10]|uniref:Glycosyltransferase n=2 Tax=Candidatus Woeseibacteriota TaxID=1752722 RepID=A0A0G0LLA7_9BACT|nr:MAG: Glycosyltransferase [Candidatus Woesebacteria bacterium GW2011_GWB1_39_10]KKS90812.1 MAG: Glycosyltransferase [Candidatus Woesebacteria bacterium GW2011_GWA1_43_12]